MRTRCPFGRRVLFCRENPLLENAFLCSRAQASVHLWAGESLGASADDRNRAARCTRRCRPHPPRFARHLPLKGKAFGRLIAVLSFRRGRTPAGPQMYAARPGVAPYGPAPAVTCSAKPGAAVGPHQQQFWNSQAPVGRIGPQKVTQILRAGNIAKPNKYASPVMGSGESGPMDLGRAKRSRSPSAASPAAFW